MNMENTKIYIATHKEFFPPSNSMYIPIHVGRQLSNEYLDYQGDDIGDNISAYNKNFCELTALYWMWKNSKADFLGLVHYRRYFIGMQSYKSKLILNEGDLHFLKKNVVIVAKPEMFYKKSTRKFFLKYKEYYSVEEQFGLNHNPKDWLELKDIFLNLYPNYREAFEFISKKKDGISLYNMFIADQTFVSLYSEWLFNILFALSKQKDLKGYDAYQARLYGFLSERLLNIYLYHHRKNLNIQYREVVMIE